MGIARFYRWLSERYPLINENITAEEIPEFDNLYLDMNGIIHNCSHNNTGGLCVKEEADVFVEAFKYIVRMVQIIKPTQLLYMAVDGCAPRAKMNQQRSRRFRAANDAREDREKKIQMGEEITGTPFDSNCITPGTEFMERLTEHLRFFVQRQMMVDPVWQGLTVVLSGPEVPGEGEHKIMDYIRSAKSQPGFNPNTRHCLYGLDADLIMLSLATHEPHFALLREEVSFRRQETKTVEQRMVIKKDRFQLLHISLLREYLNLEFQPPADRECPFTYTVERVVDDFILFCVLVGNDFLPHLPFAEISEGGLGDLFKLYKEHLNATSSNSPWLVENCGQINFPQLREYLLRYAGVEEDKLQAAIDDQHFVLGRRRMVGPEDAPDPVGRRPEEPLEIPPTPELARVQYYSVKFDMDVENHSGTQQQRKLFNSYLEGLQWVLYYYYRGPERCSWSWYYPYYHAPMIADLVNYDRLSNPGIKFDSGAPFFPFQQLMAVYPAYSKRFLPDCYQWLFDSPRSPIFNFYPQKFEIDIDGVKVPWGGVSMIPFIDPARLLAAMAEAERQGRPLTDRERQRNSFGEATQFFVDPKKKTRNVDSPMPNRFSSLTGCTVQATPFHHPALSPGSNFVNDILPGCQLIAQGFPTLKRHPVTHSEEMGVKVFQFEARDKSMIVHLHPESPALPSVDAMRKLLDAPCSLIDYPFVHRGLVTAVHTASSTLLPGGKSAANRSTYPRDHDTTVQQLLDDWRHRGLVLDFDRAEAVAAGDVAGGRFRGRGAQRGNERLQQPWAEVRVLESSHVDHEGRTQYRFKNETQLRLLHLLEVDERPTNSAPRSTADRYPLGCPVVCVAPDSGCFGEVGKIVSNADDGSLEACFDSGIHIDEDALRANVQMALSRQLEKLKWHRMNDVAKLAGVDVWVAKQILGTVFFRGADHIREEIGMNVYCEAKGDRPDVCLPAYAWRSPQNQWMFSDLAVEALQEYRLRYPSLFEALRWRQSTERDVEAKNIFWDSIDIDYAARQLVKYCNSREFKRLPLVPTMYMALATEAITDVVAAVNMAISNAGRRAELASVKGRTNLFRVNEAGNLPPSDLMFASGEDVEIGQRGIYMKAKGLVPSGTKCIVVAVYSHSNKLTLEVILDEESFGATDLHGRAPAMRGLQIAATELMPLPPRRSIGGAKDRKIATEETASTQKKNSAVAPHQFSPRVPATAPAVQHQQHQQHHLISSSTGRIQEMLKAKLEGNTSAVSSAGVSSSSVGNATGKGGGKKKSASGREDAASTFYPASRTSPAPKAGVRPVQAEMDSEQMWADAFDRLLQLNGPAPTRGRGAAR